MTFGCGHPKTPENSERNGGSAVRCRTCKQARTAARKAADPDRFRAGVRDRMRKHRGGLRGHANSRKDCCPAGHAYSPENTYLVGGARQCRACGRGTNSTRYHNQRAAGGTHTQAEWLALCEFYGHVCLRCGERRPLTRDHVLPVARGGGSEIGNIQPLCQPCNSAKGLSTTDYRRVPVAN